MRTGGYAAGPFVAGTSGPRRCAGREARALEKIRRPRGVRKAVGRAARRRGTLLRLDGPLRLSAGLRRTTAMNLPAIPGERVLIASPGSLGRRSAAFARTTAGRSRSPHAQGTRIKRHVRFAPDGRQFRFRAPLSAGSQFGVARRRDEIVEDIGRVGQTPVESSSRSADDVEPIQSVAIHEPIRGAGEDALPLLE